jgi:hypothetical protein
MRPLWWKLSRDYKKCTVCKDLQEKKYLPLRPKIYTSLAQQTVFMQSGLAYAQGTNKIPTPSQTENVQNTNQPNRQTSDIYELKKYGESS